MFRPRVLALLSLSASALAMTCACSSSAGSGDAGAVPSSTGQVISAQSTSLGTILVDGTGRTVYVFANDRPNESTCEGGCATNWPPVAAPQKLPPSVSGVTGALGTATRPDGSQQLTVAGHPVYRFSGDSGVGQTNGQGITLNGGVWTTVLPSGAPDTKPAGSTSTSTAPVPGY